MPGVSVVAVMERHPERREDSPKEGQEEVDEQVRATAGDDSHTDGRDCREIVSELHRGSQAEGGVQRTVRMARKMAEKGSEAPDILPLVMCRKGARCRRSQFEEVEISMLIFLRREPWVEKVELRLRGI